MKKIVLMVIMLLLIGIVVTGVIMAAGVETESGDIGDPCKEGMDNCGWCGGAGGNIKISANLLTNPSFEIISTSSGTSSGGGES